MTGGTGPRRTTVGRPASRRPTATATPRRSRSVRRASAGLSPIRAGGLLALLLATAGIYGVANSSAFEYARLEVDGATYTDVLDVEATIDAARGDNLFTLSTAPLAAAIADLPTVREVDVAVRLPDTLAVSIAEREPILVWRIGERRYLVDSAGALFARLGDDPPAAARSLPVVEDRRAASAGLSIGRTLDPVDLDAATRLASLRPPDVGSEADALEVLITDTSGFVVRAEPTAWSAVFGFYTPSLRTPELVPEQVRLLRSLLIGREHGIERVILASGTDGTYIPRATPRPSATPAP